MKNILFLSLLLPAVALAAPVAPPLLPEALPKDVTVFLERKAVCHKALVDELSAEGDSYDRSQSLWSEKRCGQLQDDEEGLRNKYDGQPEILNLLEHPRDRLRSGL